MTSLPAPAPPIMALSGNVKSITMSGSSLNVVIIGNFGVVNAETAVSFQHGGVWYDYFSGESFNFSGFDSINLAPGEFHIYTDQKLTTPEEGLVAIEETSANNLPEQFKVYPNHPNPFNSLTTFEYDLEKVSDVTIKIFDLLGRDIYTEKIGSQAPGKYRFVWNGFDKNSREVHSGIYFVLFQRGGNRQILKVTLLK